MIIFVFSGPDRAGKSTLISRCQKVWTEEKVCGEISVIHSGPIPHTTPAMMDYHKKPILSWLKSKNSDVCLLDRSWVCTHLLGFLRRNHTDQLDQMVDYELWLDSLGVQVVHVGLTPYWHAVARRHVTELRYEEPTASDWAIRNTLITRMHEHSAYINELLMYYDTKTIFPNVVYRYPEKVNPLCLWTDCLQRLNE